MANTWGELSTAHKAAIGAIILLIFVLLFFYSWQSWQITHLNSRLLDIKKKVGKLEDEKMALQFKVDQAFRLGRVEKVAKEEIGMVEPEELKWINLKSDK